MIDYVITFHSEVSVIFVTEDMMTRQNNSTSLLQSAMDCYYKLRQLSLLQSAMDSYYKLRQLFYYKLRQGLLQIAIGITKCDGFITNCDRYYKVR